MEINRVNVMATTRIFLIGVIVLFLGLQLRVVDTFVLNEQATKVVNSRISRGESDSYSAFAGYDPYLDGSGGFAEKRAIKPPRWLGWSFLSIGAVLVLTCPCFRR